MVLLALAHLNGCSSTIVPPGNPDDPVTVAVADYGRHSSLILPAGDRDRSSVEYAFGDWNWFAAGHNGLRDAYVALFQSDHSTLGRRFYPVAPEASQLARVLGARRVAQFDVPQAKVRALRGRLDREYESREHQEVYNADMGLWFVPHHERYRMWHNCNHVTARWVRQLGCATRGSAFWSSFRLARR